MKLRIQANSVRLRLSAEEVARVARGESILEQSRFSGGVLGYRLALDGDTLAASFTATQGVRISLPAARAMQWAASAAVSIEERLDIDGEPLSVLIEKDLKSGR